MINHSLKIEETQQQPSSNATIGGFPWSYLGPDNRDGWLREIKDRVFPQENLSAWISFIDLARNIAAAYIDTGIRRVLDDFMRADGSDAIVLDNLPVDPEVGQTPEDGERPPNKKAVSEMVMAGLIQQMKREILSYRQEKKGAAFHELVPVPGEELKQSNTGRAKFGFHTDNANLPYRFRQEGLVLFGLRNEMNVATLVVTIDDLKKQIPAETIFKLRFPIYRFPNPLSFDLGGWTTLSEPRPIIRTDDNGIDRISLPRGEFDQPDPEADRSIKDFRAALDDVTPRRVVITPGRFLAFKDSRVLHGRDTVVGDRWLQRAYFSPSLDQLRRATNSDPREFRFDARLLMMMK